jgi:hypothetical protein
VPFNTLLGIRLTSVESLAYTLVTQMSSSASKLLEVASVGAKLTGQNLPCEPGAFAHRFFKL